MRILVIGSIKAFSTIAMAICLAGFDYEFLIHTTSGILGMNAQKEQPFDVVMLEEGMYIESRLQSLTEDRSKLIPFSGDETVKAVIEMLTSMQLSV